MQLRGALDGTIARAKIGSHEITSFQDAWGTFNHLTDANSYVSDVLSENELIVRKIAAGELRAASLSKRYGYATGIEAYRETSYEVPTIRPTYSVEVVIQHRTDLRSGFIVKTAYPFNERARK
jgi:hypothetical protein